MNVGTDEVRASVRAERVRQGLPPTIPASQLGQLKAVLIAALARKRQREAAEQKAAS